MALVALERATASAPDHSLAGLLLTALDRVLPPSQVRGLLPASRWGRAAGSGRAGGGGGR